MREGEKQEGGGTQEGDRYRGGTEVGMVWRRGWGWHLVLLESGWWPRSSGSGPDEKGLGQPVAEPYPGPTLTTL